MRILLVACGVFLACVAVVGAITGFDEITTPFFSDPTNFILVGGVLYLFFMGVSSVMVGLKKGPRWLVGSAVATLAAFALYTAVPILGNK